MRLEGLTPELQLNTKDTPALLSKVQPGDIIKAQVIAIAADELALKLSDGSTVNASNLSKMLPEKGDIMNLFVKGTIDGKLLLELVDLSLSNPSDKTSENLNKLGIKSTPETLNIAQEIENNSLPFTKSIVLKAVDLLKNFKSMDIPKSVFAASNNININQTNAKNFSMLLDGNLQLSNQLDELARFISKLDIPLDPNEKIEIAVSTNTNQTAEVDGSNIAAGISDTNEHSIQENTSSIKNFSSNFVQKLGEAGTLKPVLELLGQIKNMDPEKLKTIANAFLMDSSVEYNKLPDNQKQMVLETLIKNFQSYDSKVPVQNNQNIYEDTNNQEQYQKLALSDNAEELKKADNNTQLNLKDNSNLKQKLLELIEKNIISIKSDDFKDKFLQNKDYNELMKALEDIKDALSTNYFQGKTEILEKVDNIMANVNLMKDLNNNSMYLQIPVNINGKLSSAELFVLKRNGRNKRIQKNSLTIAISLDTLNIGRVDTILSVAGKNIIINMGIDEKVFPFVKENRNEIEQKILENGYKLVDIRLKKPEEKFTPLNAARLTERYASKIHGFIDCRL